MFERVRKFNPYDLYSKSNEPPSLEKVRATYSSQARLDTFMTRLTRNAMMNRKNRIFAIQAKETAIPPNPNSAATRAIKRNTSA
jgi:hypothetical protein